jgi:hypothetical protein
MIIGEYNFQYKSSGMLTYDPGVGTKHFEPNWCLLKLDDDFYKYYSWFMNKDGEPIQKPNSLWGFHASVIKGEQPTKNIDKWGKDNGKTIEFHYGNFISWTNGRHAWMNLYCEELSDLRNFYGLYTNGNKLKYHMTLGRLKNPTMPEPLEATILIKDGSLHTV